MTDIPDIRLVPKAAQETIRERLGAFLTDAEVADVYGTSLELLPKGAWSEATRSELISAIGIAWRCVAEPRRYLIWVRQYGRA